MHLLSGHSVGALLTVQGYGRGLQSAQQLMAQDEDVIQHCLNIQSAERQRNLDARRAREQQRKAAARRQSAQFR